MATGHHQTQYSRAQPLGILGFTTSRHPRIHDLLGILGRMTSPASPTSPVSLAPVSTLYETWRYKNSLQPSDEGREQMVFPMIFVGMKILLQKGFEDANEVVCINAVYKVLRMELHTPNFWIANHLTGPNAAVL